MRRPTRPPKIEGALLLRIVRNAVRTGQYALKPHARQRCRERDLPASFVAWALETGRHVPSRDRYETRHGAWNYCIEGPSPDGAALRVIVTFQDWMMVVTVVRLGKED